MLQELLLTLVVVLEAEAVVEETLHLLVVLKDMVDQAVLVAHLVAVAVDMVVEHLIVVTAHHLQDLEHLLLLALALAVAVAVAVHTMVFPTQQVVLVLLELQEKYWFT
jgi:hypothetical protein